MMMMMMLKVAMVMGILVPWKQIWLPDYSIQEALNRGVPSQPLRTQHHTRTCWLALCT